jgi:hypothetical protein
MISYHIVAAVSEAQHTELARQAERHRRTREGRVVRQRLLRDAKWQRQCRRCEARVGRKALVGPIVAARARSVRTFRGVRPSRRLLTLLRKFQWSR